MSRKKKEPNRVDAMIDEMLAECQSPDDILGESGLLKQLTKRLVERTLSGELDHHYLSQDSDESGRSNSRNGHSKKTVQSDLES